MAWLFTFTLEIPDKTLLPESMFLCLSEPDISQKGNMLNVSYSVLHHIHQASSVLCLTISHD
jgi:hypothetical protein